MRVIRILRVCPSTSISASHFHRWVDQIERSDRLLAGQDRSSFCEQTVNPIEWCSESPSPIEWQIPQHDGSKLAVLRVIQDIQGRCSRWEASQIGLSRSKIFWIVSQVGRGFLAQLLVQIACWCGESMTYEREAVLSP